MRNLSLVITLLLTFCTTVSHAFSQEGVYSLTKSSRLENASLSCGYKLEFFAVTNLIKLTSTTNPQTLVACNSTELTHFACGFADGLCVSEANSEIKLKINSDTHFTIFSKTSSALFEEQYEWAALAAPRPLLFITKAFSGWKFNLPNSMPCKNFEAKFNKICSDVTAKDIADLGLCEAAEQLAIKNASTNCSGQGYTSCELQARERIITDGSMNDSQTFQTTVGCASSVTLKGY